MLPRPAHRPALEMLELHMPPETRGDALDLVLTLVSPRAGHGTRYLDVGLLQRDAAGVAAQTARTTHKESPADAQIGVTPRVGAWRRRGGLVSFDLSLTAIAHLGGNSLARASGELRVLDRSIALDDRPIIIGERRVPRRPYAWARATLFGTIDEQPFVCLVETTRRRAGSVVLPELGRLRMFGPGARRLPRACVLAPLPMRAEYGTGRLRAAALAPGHRIEVELDAPHDQTALFEVVDPNGDAAYAHRALGATARLRVVARKRTVIEVALTGRYEWGARAGDPRVEHRAWRA